MYSNDVGAHQFDADFVNFIKLSTNVFIHLPKKEATLTWKAQKLAHAPSSAASKSLEGAKEKVDRFGGSTCMAIRGVYFLTTPGTENSPKSSTMSQRSQTLFHRVDTSPQPRRKRD